MLCLVRATGQFFFIEDPAPGQPGCTCLPAYSGQSGAASSHASILL